MNDGFLSRVEYLFGFFIYASYEGGYLVLVGLGGILIELYGEVGKMIKNLRKDYKTYSYIDGYKEKFKKECRKGVLYAFILFAFIYGSFILLSNGASERERPTQLECEIGH